MKRRVSAARGWDEVPCLSLREDASDSVNALAMGRQSRVVKAAGDPRAAHYSQRNTLAERAVHTANTATSAATSPRCARHGSPFQIPSSSETA